MKNIYIFSEKDLEYKKISFREFLILPLILIFAAIFNYCYFYAPLVETIDWRGEKINQTIQETVSQYLVQKNYDSKSRR